MPSFNSKVYKTKPTVQRIAPAAPGTVYDPVAALNKALDKHAAAHRIGSGLVETTCKHCRRVMRVLRQPCHRSDEDAVAKARRVCEYCDCSRADETRFRD